LFFKKALEDYRYLKERDYPEKAALKLIGDRYRLSRLARNCLFRGVEKTSVAADRRKKLVSAKVLRSEALAIDWYNVLITVESYLKGYPVFLADDGIVRDASGIHGSYRRGKITDRVIQMVLESLEHAGFASVEIYLDSPIAFSGEMAALLRHLTSGRGYRITAAPSPDYYLKAHPGVVASSDSVILDSAAKVLDLPRLVLESRLGFTPLGLDDFRLGNPPEPG